MLLVTCTVSHFSFIIIHYFGWFLPLCFWQGSAWRVNRAVPPWKWFLCLSWSCDSQKNEWLRLDDLRYRAGFGFGAGHFQGINYQVVLPAFSWKPCPGCYSRTFKWENASKYWKKSAFFLNEENFPRLVRGFFFWAKICEHSLDFCRQVLMKEIHPFGILDLPKKNPVTNRTNVGEWSKNQFL